MSIVNLYLDDSGTRHPNKNPGKVPSHGFDWFALGGVVVRQENEDLARNIHSDFCREWGIEYPLHSSEIRNQTGNFRWLRNLDGAGSERFYEELYQLMRAAPVLGLSCVIDRPGYNNRYSERYNNEPWSLCKTAFCVVVERAAKWAQADRSKLRVAPERCNRREDSALKSYYNELRSAGMPFSSKTSDKYAPLSKAEFTELIF